MPRKDFTQVALDVVRRATGEEPAPAPTPKQEAGRKGGTKGGKSRMDALSPEERRELALKAAGARWKKSAPAPVGTGARKR
jgi:hypothetical protein